MWTVKCEPVTPEESHTFNAIGCPLEGNQPINHAMPAPIGRLPPTTPALGGLHLPPLPTTPHLPTAGFGLIDQTHVSLFDDPHAALPAYGSMHPAPPLLPQASECAGFDSGSLRDHLRPGDGYDEDDDSDDGTEARGVAKEPSGDAKGSADQLGKKRKRTAMTREERKHEDMQQLNDQIDGALRALSVRLKQAMAQVVYYPNPSPGLSGGADAAELLKQLLPPHTDPSSLKKNRDPHVHYTYYESHCLFVSREIELAVAQLQKVLLAKTRLYRYRKVNNCRKVWTNPVDLENAPLSAFQQEMRTCAPTPAKGLLTGLPLTAAVSLGNNAGNGGAQTGTVITPTSAWSSNLSALRVAPVNQQGQKDPLLERIGFFKVVKPKRARRNASSAQARSAATDTNLVLKVEEKQKGRDQVKSRRKKKASTKARATAAKPSPATGATIVAPPMVGPSLNQQTTQSTPNSVHVFQPYMHPQHLLPPANHAHFVTAFAPLADHVTATSAVRPRFNLTPVTPTIQISQEPLTNSCTASPAAIN